MVILLIFVIGVVIVVIVNYKDKEIRSNERLDNDSWITKNNYHPKVDFFYESIMHDMSARFMVDEDRKTILITNNSSFPVVVRFDDVMGCDIRENNQISGGIGRAIVGGVLAGGIGAIVGATTAKKHVESYDVVILLNSISKPELVIKLINKKVSTSDIDYKHAMEFANHANSTIKAILNQNKSLNINMSQDLSKVEILELHEEKAISRLPEKDYRPSTNIESSVDSIEVRYDALTYNDKNEIRKYIDSRYNYFDDLEGIYCGDKYSELIWKETARKYGLTDAQITEIIKQT